MSAAGPRLEIVVATDRRGLIGRAGGLPWHLPADLAHFKRTTLGHPVVMGRTTWDSIGRPLPGRRNLVLSRDPAFRPEGAEVLGGLAALVAAVRDEDRVMIIGGARIYRQFLPLCDRVHLTEVDGVFAGDTYFPTLDRRRWREVARRRRDADERNPHPMSFLEFERAV
ncbi:MAG: dihydrofolate reductase [Planctomycetota bacterium]